jgi:hypothetical protein
LTSFELGKAQALEVHFAAELPTLLSDLDLHRSQEQRISPPHSHSTLQAHLPQPEAKKRYSLQSPLAKK